MSLRIKFVATALLLTFLLSPLRAVSAAGGEIAGTVTDPKGAVVVGATVTVLPEAGGQPVATVKTGAQGQYKVPNVPPGNYTVTVVAEGFGPVTSATQTVAEGKTLKLDFKLEVAAVETSVTVSAAGAKPNSDPGYQALRRLGEAADFAGDYAQVSNLVLKRDAATFTLASGELYFLPAVEGRVTGAVFVGEGEMTLTPPVEYEKRSLAIFTGEPSITEKFTKLTLRFTDKTYEEIKSSPQARMARGGAQAGRARARYPAPPPPPPRRRTRS